MIRGKISAGNGLELNNALGATDFTSAKLFLEKHVKDGFKSSCDSLLLSSEGFFHSFPKEGVMDCLVQSANDAGIDEIYALVYFRDPVSHALSLYKHRAKDGNISDYNSWLENSYETMDLIDGFLQYHLKHPVEWTCRKYKADSDFMAVTAFKDWLGLKKPEIPSNDKVNESLTLSEIVTIQALNKVYPGIATYLNREFANIKKKDKGKDTILNEFYQYESSKILVKYHSLINVVNELLPNDEKLALRYENKESIIFSGEDISIRKNQLLAIAKAVKQNVKSEQISGKILQLLRKVAGKYQRIRHSKS